MIISKRINAKSYQEMNIFLFGATAGRIINVFMLFVLLGVTSVMLSGAGALLRSTGDVRSDWDADYYRVKLNCDD